MAAGFSFLQLFKHTLCSQCKDLRPLCKAFWYIQAMPLPDTLIIIAEKALVMKLHTSGYFNSCMCRKDG